MSRPKGIKAIGTRIAAASKAYPWAVAIIVALAFIVGRCTA